VRIYSGKLDLNNSKIGSRAWSIIRLLMKSLLVIGGSDVISQLMVHIFEIRGWKVEACRHHWDTAIARLAGYKIFDAVILSDSLDKSVFEMIRLIRSVKRKRSLTLVVVAANREINRDAVLAAGADELLVRPFNSNSLIWAIEWPSTRRGSTSIRR
jgi:DNA-binding response OmpR family regulator